MLFPKLLTVAMFQQMAEAGLFAPDERIELIGGELITMSPIGPLHAALVNRLIRSLLPQAGAHNLLLSTQNPLIIDQTTQFQPDVMLLRESADEYATQHPTAADALLVIEVSDSTLNWDRREKLPHYAAVAIPEVWIINVAQQRVEQYTDPRRDVYHAIVLVEPNEILVAYSVPISLAVSELFPASQAL